MVTEMPTMGTTMVKGFRLGEELEAEFTRRAHIGAVTRIRSDLGRYYALLGEALGEYVRYHFTEQELVILAKVVELGFYLGGKADVHSARTFHWQVDDALVRGAASAPEGYDRAGLVKRVFALPLVARVALVDALEAYNQRHSRAGAGRPAEDFQAVGLMGPESTWS